MNIKYFDEVVKKMKELWESSLLEATFFAKMKIIVKCEMVQGFLSGES
jgi:hypothetical protein